MIKEIRYIIPFVLQKAAWPFARLKLWFLFRLRVKGGDKLKNLPKGTIFAVNHTNSWDPIILTAAIPFFSHLSPMFYTARERSFYDAKWYSRPFLGGLFFELWGAYQVYPGLHDYEEALENHIYLLKNNIGPVCFFPEGGITKDGKLRKGKGGVVYLSDVTGAPLVPVAIKGHYRANIIDMLLGRRKVTVVFGDPMTDKELGRNPGEETYTQRAQRVMRRIQELLNSTS